MSVVCDRACRAQLLNFWSKVMLLVCLLRLLRLRVPGDGVGDSQLAGVIDVQSYAWMDA